MNLHFAPIALFSLILSLFISCTTKTYVPLPEQSVDREGLSKATPGSDEDTPVLTAESAGEEFMFDDMDIDSLKQALDRSRQYLKKPSIQKQSFVYGDLTYSANEILLSYDLFEKLLDEFDNKQAFLKKLNEQFLILKSPGKEDSRMVQFTGYYEPVVAGSKRKDGSYNIPAYGIPSDLKTLNLGDFRPDLDGRTIKYRNDAGKIIPYYTRKEITETNVLKGKSEIIAWFKDPVDHFFMQIQGSGIIRTPENKLIRLGYAGANGRPYSSIGKYLIDKGVMTLDTMSMQNIRAYLSQNPSEVGLVLNVNESYTFFEEQDIAEGPYGNINVPLTPGRSIATDTLLFPKAAIAFISTEIPNCDTAGNCSGTKKISRFVVNQDTGGAIKGFGRADIFWGRGEYAEAVAGRMKYYGNMYFIVAKKHLLANIS